MKDTNKESLSPDTMKKTILLSLALASTPLLTACQEERIALNEVTEEIEEVVQVEEIATNNHTSPSNPTPIKQTQINELDTTEILDYANSNYYFKIEYPSSSTKMEIKKQDTTENLAMSTFLVTRNEETILQIDVYDDEALEEAYNELDELETDYDTDNHSYSLNFITADEDLLRIIRKSFYAEDL